MASEEKYIQIGEAMMRDPGTGEFTGVSFPLFVRDDDGWASEAKARLEKELGRIFADALKKQMQAQAGA